MVFWKVHCGTALFQNTSYWQQTNKPGAVFKRAQICLFQSLYQNGGTDKKAGVEELISKPKPK